MIFTSDFKFATNKLSVTNSDYVVDVEKDVVISFVNHIIKKFKLPRDFTFRSMITISNDKTNLVEYYLFDKRHRLLKNVIVHGKIPPLSHDISRRLFIARYNSLYNNI